MTRRFAVQEHTLPAGQVHFDLLIEDGAVLVTVQLDQEPGGARATGRRSFDHRPLYLDYEGPISGGRGSVRLWDGGRLEDVLADPRAHRYRARFDGARLQGLYELRAAEGEAVSLERLGPGA